MAGQGGWALRIVASIWVGLFVLPGSAAVQAPSSGPAVPPPRASEQHVWYTLGRVATLTGAPVPGAAIAVYLDTMTSPELKLETNYQGEFEISMKVDPNRTHRVKVVAKKDGYLGALEWVDMTLEKKPEVIDLVLRSDSEDDQEDQLPIRTLISRVADGLREPAGNSRPGHDRSETVQAARALLEARKTDGALRLLEKAVEQEPDCVELRTLHALAMLEAGSWSSATRQLNETAVLNASVEPGSQRPEPNLILGVLECWRGSPENAVDLFLRALDTGPPSPLLLQEFGRAYFQQRNWSEAETYLMRAIEAGASPDARWLRAKALLAAARPHEAQAELGTCLEGKKPKDLPIAVRMSWIKLDNRLELELESEANDSKTVVKQTPGELLESIPELQGLEPAKGQEELPSILEKVGEGVEAFFRDFHNSTSREEVRQELLNRDGKVNSFLKQNYQYWLLTYPDASEPALNEYRTDRSGTATAPGTWQEGFILTKGFASAPAFLLPAYQPESTFAYLGRQRVDGHDTHVIAFAQRPESARLQGGFRQGGFEALTLSQGVVWIDPSTYQITRLRTDLLNPVAKAHLNRETTEIRYGEVHIKDVPLPYWLPLDVVVTVEWKGKLRRNRHSYSNFHLFNVESKILASPDSVQK